MSFAARPSSTLRYARLLLLTLATVGVNACGGDSTGTDEGDEIASVTVTPATAEVDIGQTVQLDASVLNGRGESVGTAGLTWSSGNTSVATVGGSGLVTGVDAGTATITASVAGVSDQATVTVVDPNPPEAPSDVTAMPVSDDVVEVVWEDNSTNETGFVILREPVEPEGAAEADGPARVFSEAGQVGPNVESFRDEGLDPGTSYRYAVEACNDNGCTGGEDSGVTSEVVVTHEELLLETGSLPQGVEDEPYEEALVASGGSGAFTWSAEGDVPEGLELDEDGVLSGTPTTAGSYTFTATVTSGEQSVSKELTLEISEEILPPVVVTEELDDGVVGEAYEAVLAAEQGDGSYAWQVVEGELPDGVELAGDGTLAGTPTEAGSFAFTVVVESAGLTGEAELTLTVYEALAVTPADLPDGTVDEAYSASLEATGGNPPYTWTVLEGALPDGLTLTSAGEITGTPTGASGPTSFTVQATSSDGQTATAELSLEVFLALAITTGSLPAASVGEAYEESVLAEGGDLEYGWSLAGGELPSGMSLSEEDPVDGGPTEAVISGTPDEEGIFTFTVRVTDGRGETATQELTIEVVLVTEVAISTVQLQPGLAGAPYGGALAAEGGDGENYAWTVVSGAVPSGLTLEADGTFSGSPSATGTFTFTVEVTSADRTDTAEFTVEVVAHDQSDYNITAVNVSSPAEVVQARVEAAIERWEAVLQGDLEATLQGQLASASCGGFGELVSGVAADDLVLLINIDEIDGSGGTLGFAGPCGFVRNNGLPLTGILTLDEVDLLDMASTPAGEDLMEDVVFHEIGHVLGFGTLWRFDPFFDLVAGEETNNPLFTGALAVHEYADLGGSGDVPVENDGGSGTALGHWEESGSGEKDMAFDPTDGRQGFDSEIMTGFAEPAGQDRPLSRLTIASLEDMGYVVSYGTAESFDLPAVPAAISAAEGEGGVAFGDDMLLEPLYVRTADGSVRVLHPRR